MSDRQDQKNEIRQQRRAQDFIDLGYSPQVAERMASNFPLAFSGADKLRSGAVVNQDQLNELWRTFKTVDLEGGAQNMSWEEYLADPRAAVRRENGQYVWRPDLQQGEFLGVNRESFLDTVMGSPIGTVLLPAAGGAIMSAAGMMGNAAGSSGFLGDVAAGAGGIADAAAAAAGTTAGGAAAGEFALAGPGAGVGGVGTSGLGLGSTGSSIGLTPGLTTAGGTALTGGAIGAAADSLAGAAGVGALSSVPTTAQLASMLGTAPSVAQQVIDVAKQAMSKPGVTSQVLSQAIKGATGLDVSPEVINTIGKVAAVGLAASGGGGGSNNVSGTAAAQGSAATDAFGLAKEQWAWNKARADEIWPQTKALVQQQLDIGKASADRADQAWQTYQNLYLPQETKYVDTMANWDSPDRRTQRIQEATADVNRGYDAARGTMERGLERVGVRPGGAGFTQAMGDLTRAQAADTAGAQNKARRDVEQEGLSGLSNVVNIGRGYPASANSTNQLALQAGNSANANTNQNTVTTNAGLSSAQGWFGNGVQALNSAGNMQNQAYQNDVNSSAGIGRLLGALFAGGFKDGGLVRRGCKSKHGYADGGIVRRAEMKLQKHLRPMMNMRMQGYAEGGLVRGPGTSTSDSIPAVIDGEEPTALSTGEAVLNAEAVQLVGPEFVERINQAGLERRGGNRVIEGQSRRVM